MLSIIDGMWAASLAALPTLMVTISDVTTVGSGLSAYTVYNVLVVHPSHPETKIPRRHSEFVALHHCLKIALANDNPDLSSFFDFEFVKKSVLKSKEALVAERKAVLQKYLTLISTNPVLFGSNFVKRFLSFPMVLPIENKNKFDDVWQFHQNRLQLIKQLNYVINTVIPPEKLAPFVPSTPLAFSQQLTTKQIQITGNKVVTNLDRSGRPGDSASAGRNGESGHGPGNDGKSGTSGGDGKSGDSAQRISVFIQSDPQLQKLTVNDRENNQVVSADEFYLNSITLAANGGNGGAGGAGGNGGHGAQGRQGTAGTRGQNGTSYSHDGQAGHPGGPGGPGGNGGDAGHGGRGGDGGNAADIQIYCHDPRTLLAVTARSPQGGVGGRGGRGGTAGHGGAGGHGGRGGDGGMGATYQETETYYDRDPDGRSIQRTRSVTRHGRNGPRGHDGPAGRPGNSGSNGYNGADGRNGSDANLTFFVLDANGGVIESATSIYHPSIVVVATDGDCDGIFSPGDTITFTVATVMNEGGLTLPAGAQLMKSDHTPVVTLPAIAPQEQCSIKASYTITVPTIPEPTSPGVFSALLGETITMEFEGKTFMSYLSTYSSRWPFKLASVNFPKVLSPGDSTQVSVSISNLSKYEYGVQSVVQVAIKLPLGLSLPIPPDSISDMVQKWVMNTNDDLECSFPIAMEDNVFSPDESVKARVELYWKGTFIEFMEFEVKAVPTWKTYLAGPPADVVILHNTIKSTDEHMAWSKVTNHLNLTAYFWDTNYYPIDLFDEYITNPKCSNAVLVCSLDPANEVVKNTVQTHLQRNKSTGYVHIDKDMTSIPIDGICDVGGALTSFHADASDSRYWSLLTSQSWYDFKSLFAPSLTLPVISRLICALPIFQKFSLLTERLADLPCYGWIWEEVGITVLDIVARSLKYDFVTSFQAKDFMAQRVVQKVLLEHSDFARNKQVVGAVLVAMKRVDKLVRVFTHDKVWDHMKRCLKNALALDGEFKKECKVKRELVTKRLKHIKAVLNSTLELKKTK